jgi:hypothetical protein
MPKKLGEISREESLVSGTMTMQFVMSQLLKSSMPESKEEKKLRKKDQASAKRKSKNKPIAVIDLETDPFLYGRIPKPFAAGFYSTELGFISFWGVDCIDALLSFLNTLQIPHLIYAHNGGKFDYMYFVDRLDNPIKIINGRIAKAKFGIHELRDSYSIMPMPLSNYKKDEIDYSHFEVDKREKHKTKIIEYLKGDCIYLHELVTAFVERFGTKLTIGSTAIAELRKLTEFETTGATFDSVFRPFYYGGRVECFKPGIHKGKFKVIDVNSMYPFVMREYSHPAGSEYLSVSDPEIDKNGELIGYEGETYLAIVIARNKGALPFREISSLNFNKGYAEFYATSHEIKVALKYKKIEILKVKAAYTFFDEMDFTEYIDKYSAEKVAAKENDDKVAEIFAKFLLNSLYGKFGSNPDNYFDYHILKHGEEIPAEWLGYDDKGIYGIENWTLHESHPECEIWKKPSPHHRFFNVATAASITGAARAVLLDAIYKIKSPFYCDTDSIIFQGSSNYLNLDKSKLGAWKLEATGDRLAIAGKKLYALMNNSECVKLASKGARLAPGDIFNLCKGETIEWKNNAPNMKMSGDAKFVKRNIRMT